MQKMRIDKRKKWYLVIDTETAGPLNSPLVYDIGYSVTDKKGNIIFKRHYLVHEIFNLQPDLMKSCFYNYKIPLYRQKVQAGQIKVRRFLDIMYEIREVIKRLNIKVVAAYNCNFDRKALNNTLRFLTEGKEKWFFPYGVEYFCIWHMACQVICTQKTFLRWAAKFQNESQKGNVLTNAEVVYQYLTGEYGFVEEHMGLDDVLIEVFIMARCFRQHKKMEKGISPCCWRIPQKAYKEIKGV